MKAVFICRIPIIMLIPISDSYHKVSTNQGPDPYQCYKSRIPASKILCIRHTVGIAELRIRVDI